MLCDIFIIFSFIDLKSDEQKLKESREEFLSTPYVSEAIEAATVLIHDRNTYGNGINIQSINVLHASRYVKIVFSNTKGAGKEFYYDCKNNKTITDNAYSQALTQAIANNTYFGSSKKISTSFDGNLLYQIIQEARGK